MDNKNRRDNCNKQFNIVYCMRINADIKRSLKKPFYCVLNHNEWLFIIARKSYQLTVISPSLISHFTVVYQNTQEKPLIQSIFSPDIQVALKLLAFKCPSRTSSKERAGSCDFTSCSSSSRTSRTIAATRRATTMTLITPMTIHVRFLRFPFEMIKSCDRKAPR